MGGKWLELLKQIAPGVTRVALLFDPATTVPCKVYMSSIEAAASSFAIRASAAPVHAKDEIEGVVAALAGNPGAGLIVMPDLFNTVNRDLIIGWRPVTASRPSICFALSRIRRLDLLWW